MTTRRSAAATAGAERGAKATQPAPVPSEKRGAAKSGRDPAPADALASLQRSLRYSFENPALLELALTHRSHPYEARGGGTSTGSSKSSPGANDVRNDQKNEPGTDNEQLEFVGDAVLGLVVTEALYQYFPQRSEGELTRLRASLVSRQRMAELGAELGLGEYLKMGKSAETNGGRHKPALLANTVEAVVAAVYLDSGRLPGTGLRAVRELIGRLLMTPELPRLRAALAEDAGRGAMRDAKTLLQERVQAGRSGRLRYADVGESGPAHQKRFAVEVRLEDAEASVALASAEGSSKKEAQQRAATLALAAWHPEPGGEEVRSREKGSKAGIVPAKAAREAKRKKFASDNGPAEGAA